MEASVEANIPVVGDGYEPEAILYSRPGRDGNLEYLVRKVPKGDALFRNTIPIAPDLLTEGAQLALDSFLNVAAAQAEESEIGRADPEEQVTVQPWPENTPQEAQEASASTRPTAVARESKKRKRTIADDLKIPPFRGPRDPPRASDAEEPEVEDRNARANSAPAPAVRPLRRTNPLFSTFAVNSNGIVLPPGPAPAKRSVAMQNAAQKVRRKEAKHKCSMCGRDFTRRANLTSHMQTHMNIRPYQCTRCPRAFVRRHELKRHEALHDSAPDGVVRWGGMRTRKSRDSGDKDAEAGEVSMEDIAAAAANGDGEKEGEGSGEAPEDVTVEVLEAVMDPAIDPALPT